MLGNYAAVLAAAIKEPDGFILSLDIPI